MSSLFSLYREALPPSVITHAVAASLTAPGARNLVVAKSTVLEVYNVVETDEEAPETANGEPSNGHGGVIFDADVGGPAAGRALAGEGEKEVNPTRRGARLELLVHKKLHGVITSLGVVRTAVGAGAEDRDSILLSFADAKLSLLEWQPGTHDLVTVSIHYYEREELKSDSKTPHAPKIRTDPSNRCAVMQVYGDKLAVVPFKQSDFGGAGATLAGKHPFYPSFVVPFTQIDSKIRHVIDIAFLDGYFEPTLAILYEPLPTWTARVAARYDTVSLVVVSLDLSRRSFPVLFHHPRLPYNSFALHPLPVAVGGVLVLSPNGLVHADQTSLPGTSVGVNPYWGAEENNEGGMDVGPPSRYGPAVVPPGPLRMEPNALYRAPNMTVGYEGLGIAFAGGFAVQADPDTLLLCTREGELVRVEMVGNEDAGRGWGRRKGGVRRFVVERCGVRVRGVPAVACAVGEIVRSGREGFVFAALRDADPVLFRFYEAEDGDGSGAGKRRAAEAEAPQAKRLKVAGDADADDDLYGDDGAPSAAAAPQTNGVGDHALEGASRLRFYAAANLTSVGPLKDIILSAPTWWPSSALRPSDQVFPYAPQVPRRDMELLACSGSDDTSGTLITLRENVAPVIIGSMADIGFKVKEMWSVRGPVAPALPEGMSKGAMDAERYHKYLVMSGERRKEKVTLVMDASGEELVFTDREKFFREGATVDVDTVLSGTLIVQVHTAGVLVLDIAGNRLQEIPSDRLKLFGETKERAIRVCEIEDPYVLLTMSDGELVLLQADPETDRLKVIKEVVVSRLGLLDDPTGAKASGTLRSKEGASGKASKQKKKQAPQPKKVADDYLDELDRDLYGGGGDREDDLYGDQDDDVMELFPEDDEDAADAHVVDDDMPDAGIIVPEDKSGNTYWCAAVRDDGELAVFSIPDFKQCFRFPHFSLLPGMLYDHGVEAGRAGPSGADGDAVPAAKVGIDIVEILMVDFGSDEATRDVYLMARTESDDLVIYKGFNALIRGDDGTVDAESLATGFTPAGLEDERSREARDFDDIHPPNRLATRFVRVEQPHLLRESQFYVDVEKTDKEIAVELPEDPTFVRRRYMRVANKLLGREGSEYQAVFVAGARPCIITALRTSHADCGGLSLLDPEDAAGAKVLDPPSRRHPTKHLWIHPLTCDGEIKSFAAFNTPAVQHGFVYFNQASLLRVCQLPSRYDAEFHWPIRKIPLDRTPHHLVSHPSSEKVVLSSSKKVNFLLPRAQYAAAVTAGVIEDGEEYNGAMPDKDPLVPTDVTRSSLPVPGAYMPQTSAYSLELVSPITWEPVDVHEFGEYEVVLDAKPISFESKQTVSGRKLYIVVGTGMQRSEDLAARGKLYVFEIIEVVPEPGRPETNHKFKMLYQSEEKGLPGPVTQLCQVKQYVLAAVGNRLILHEFEDDALNGIAFIDTNMYVTAACALRNLMLVGDLRKSIWFMGFQEDPAKIGSLGRDMLPMHVTASEFLIDYNSLYFIIGDDERNIMVYAFDEKDPTSLGGSKLVRKAEFHVGNRVEKMIRMRKVGLPRKKGGPAPTSKQHASMLASADGSLSFVMPISEKMYRRLLSLSTRLLNALPHPAGLNPRGFRRAHSHIDRLTSGSSMRNPIDGDLLFRFVSLPFNRQKELSRSIGSTLERVLDDMLEVEMSVDYF
ncbi:CPSF A subunit region-domain-containing protein [Hyaloraphidium curvatum]|nr:CPSF A subunit region-domain-containing protein [Hyaloraphidium curvatum]